MTVCYSLSPDDLSYGIYSPLVYFLLHRLMIALKYASMTQEEYERALPPRPLKEGEMNILREYTNQSQIIAGLLGQNRELMEFHLAAAAAELGLDLPRIYINVPKCSWRREHDDEDISSLATWEVFIKDGVRELYKSDKETDAESRERQFDLKSDILDINAEIKKLDSQAQSDQTSFVKIPIGLLAMALLGRCAKTYVKVVITAGQAAMVLLVFATIQPFLVLRFTPTSTNGYTVTYFVVSTILNLSLGIVAIMLLSGTLYDALRKRSLSLKLNDMIIPNAKCFMYNLKVLKFLFDRSNGNIDFVFGDNFQKKKDEYELETLLRKVEQDGDELEDKSVNDNKGKSKEEFILDAKKISREHDQKQKQGSQDEEKKRGNVSDVDRLTSCQVIFKPPMPTMLVNSNNILAFLALRQVMQIYGKRFVARLDLLITVTAQLILIMMLVFIIALATSTDPTAIFNSVLFRQSMIAVAMFSIAVIAVVTVGGFANDSYNNHRESLSSHQFRVQSRLVNTNLQCKQYRDLKKVYEKRLKSHLHCMCMNEKAEMAEMEAEAEAATIAADTPPPFADDERDMDHGNDQFQDTSRERIYGRSRRRSADSDDDDDTTNKLPFDPVPPVQPVSKPLSAMKLKRDIPRLEARIAALEVKAEAESNLLEVLSYVADAIDMGNEFHPIKFVGFTCTLEVAYSLFTTVVTFFGYMVAALSSSGTMTGL